MSQMNESEMARRSVYSLGKGIPHGGRNVASVIVVWANCAGRNMGWDVGNVGEIEEKGDHIAGYRQGLIKVAHFGD